MHDLASPHCSYCQHFESAFQTDLVIEWGYCGLKKIPGREDLERIKAKVETGDLAELYGRAQEIGLFMPAVTRCTEFADLYPF